MTKLMSIKCIPLKSIALAIALTGCNDSGESNQTFVSSERNIATLDSDWSFQMDYSDLAATTNDFDDSNWEDVDLPHVWDIENGQTGNGYFHGESTYRKNLPIQSIQTDKRYYLEFEGAALISTLYVNGQQVGKHNGGFSTFRFDITDYLKSGDNLIAVQVDNRLSSMQPDIDNNFGRETFLPLDSGADFTWWGGIYRDVNLLTLDDVLIDAEDFGGSGVYLSQKLVSADNAIVEASVHLRNKSDTDFSGDVLITIKNAEDNTVKTLTLPATIKSGEVLVLNEEFTIDSPHLWNGVKDPYLYQVYTQLIEDESVIDQVKQPLGLRSFEFSPTEGFILNGESYPLRGVAMHQDYMDMGWATNWDQRKESIDIIRDMGANTIRMAHYPHNLDAQAYSDQLGFINWSEIPMINAVSLDPSYLDSAKQQLTEMIKQFYNHPSIGVWGITNEIMSTNTVSESDTAALVKVLSDYAKELDKGAYRKTTQAAVLFDSVDSQLHASVDVNSYNRYDGWYMGTTDDFGVFLDSFTNTHSDRVLGVSEYGAGASAYWHSDSPTMGDHTEEYSQFYHEQSLAQIEARPHLWGTHLWNMFNFSVSNRNEGDTKGRNDKGLVSLDRKTKKDAFYLYQAAWSDNPMVHIASKRQMESCPTDAGLTTSSDLCGLEGSTRSYVKAYSNLDELTLYVNGAAYSTKNLEDNNFYPVFEWDNLELAPGEYQVEVRGTQDGDTYSDSYTYIRLASESNSLTSSSIAIVNSEDETTGEDTGILSQLPYQVSLGQLKESVSLPPGATLYISGQSDSYVIQPGDTVTVTSESGAARIYTVEVPSDLAFARPVTDNGIKDTFFTLDNPQHLTDDDPTTLWTSVSAAAISTAEIDLQHVFYIDEVEIQQGHAYIDYPGDVYVEAIGTNVVAVDHVVHTSEGTLVTQPTYSWPIGYEGKNVRVEFSPSKSTKTLPHPMGGLLPAPIISKVKVYGGLIHSSTISIDYRNRLITLPSGNPTVADIKADIETVSSQHGSFEVNVYASNGNLASGSDLVMTGYTVEVLRHVNDVEYREVYSLVD